LEFDLLEYDFISISSWCSQTDLVDNEDWKTMI